MNNCGLTKKADYRKLKRVQEKGVTIYMLIIFMTKNSCNKKIFKRQRTNIIVTRVSDKQIIHFTYKLHKTFTIIIYSNNKT